MHEKIKPVRIHFRELPDDFIDDSLHRHAVWVNQDDEIPVAFPEHALKFLLDLAYTLPRRGFLFNKIAREFVPTMAIDCLPEPSAAVVHELRAVSQAKEDAIAAHDFDKARELRDRQYLLRERIASIPTHSVAPDEIRDALRGIGVDLDGTRNPSGQR